MSKSLKTKLFFLVTMTVCLVCALGIGAFAQENTASTGTPLETRYGTFYIPEGEERDVLLVSAAGRGIILSSALIPLKTTRTSAGVQLITMKPGQLIEFSSVDFADLFDTPPKLRKTKIPAAGTALPEEFKIPYSDLPLD
jgi:hypothetical protein